MLCDYCHCCVLQDPEEAIERGCGQRRTTKLKRGKWVAIDSYIKYVETIKVRRQNNINQMRRLFISQMLQHREDKVLKNYVFFFNSKT